MIPNPAYIKLEMTPCSLEDLDEISFLTARLPDCLNIKNIDRTYLDRLILRVIRVIQRHIIPDKLNRIIEFLLPRKRLFPSALKNAIKRALQGGNSTGNQSNRISLPQDLRGFRGFGIPTNAQARVTIVIPVHNHIETTLKCLNSIRLSMTNTPYSILIVNDGSNDQTLSILSKIRGITVIDVMENVGYLNATNLGIQHCESEFVCLLNNDTRVTSGWLDSLVRTLDQNSSAVITGGVLIASDGTIAEAGSQIFREREIWNLARGLMSRVPIIGFLREVDYLSAACILVRNSFLNQVGGFDTRFTPAYFEDTDLATTAWSLGYKVLFTHDSFVFHDEGISHGTDPSKGIKKYQVTNSAKFWQKWGGENLSKWSIKSGPRFEHKKDSRGIIIFVDDLFPDPYRDSGSNRAYKIILELQKQGFHIVFLAASHDVNQFNIEKLNRLGIETHLTFTSLINSMEAREHRLFAVWISRVTVAQMYWEKLKKKFATSSFVFDTVDLHYLREIRQNSISSHGSGATSISKEVEFRFAMDADLTILVADYEKQILDRELGNIRSKVLWTYEDFLPAREAHAFGSSILFVGTFYHTPNVDAILWFVDQILPMVPMKVRKEAKFIVIGAGLSEENQKLLKDSGVDYLGWVQDLTPFYANARVVIAPLRFGAGRKGKVLEAISHSAPLVVTSVANEGLDLQDSNEVLIADNEVDFATHLSYLWNHPENGIKMAHNARNRVQGELSYSNFSSLIAEIIGDVPQICKD